MSFLSRMSYRKVCSDILIWGVNVFINVKFRYKYKDLTVRFN